MRSESSHQLILHDSVSLNAWQGKELPPLPYTLSEVMAAATDAEDAETALYVAKVGRRWDDMIWR